MSNVVMFGLGYVGATTTACLLRQGHSVVGIDISPDKVELVRKGQSPVREPYVSDMLAQGRAEGRLNADTQPERYIVDADFAIVAVGTPSKRGGSLSVDQVQKVAAQIGSAVRHRAPGRPPLQCIFRSTLPPGAMQQSILPTLEAAAGDPPAIRYEPSLNPEFLREGTAVEDYFAPPAIILGERFRGATGELAGLYRDIDVSITKVSFPEAEFIKIINNSFHALKVTFANEVGRLCLAHQVDPQTVMNALTADRKLNLSPCYLRPGGAFGGSCLPKDVRALLTVARFCDARVPVIEGILQSNELHKEYIARSLMAAVPPQSHILQIGLTFKNFTDDLRESPLVDLAHTLIEEGYRLSIYEPDLVGAALTGANLAFLESKLPDIAERLVPDLSSLGQVDFIVLGKPLADSKALRGVPIIDAMRLTPSTWVKRSAEQSWNREGSGDGLVRSATP
ncbi:MAG TPA: nucleotide sugar dehydrogenase [Vicinamibacterales bacterium]|jgi:GDP-mannose 6-dehydrogenase